MLMRTDPFRELDRINQQLFGHNGTSSRPALMPMDAYRHDNEYRIQLDLPGIDPDSIDLDVEQNVLTVKAERQPSYTDNDEVQIAERPRGVFSRQLFLGETLDTNNITADYQDGVLTLTVPVAERAKPRKITINTKSGQNKQINA